MSTRILVGDCRDVLPTLEAGSVQCVVTSPPYFGLRDYNVAGQIGLEATPAAYVAEIVAVFREVWRVLRDDGTCWLNLGDSFASAPSGSFDKGQRGSGMDGGGFRSNKAMDTTKCGFKAKDLMGMPWRVAFALQDAGWYLRRDIIWAKPNPMPESVTDRPTTAHEYVFLLTKSARYFYDAEAVREPHQDKNGTDRFVNGCGVGERHSTQGWAGGEVSLDKHRNYNPAGRNLRSVWTIPTSPFSEAHFATFPPKLAETCILAGTSERGACPDCGAAWARVIEAVDTGKTQVMAAGWASGPGSHGTINADGRSKGEAGVPVTANATTGWRPICDCPAADPRPCRVLDPFGGAGTVGLVADRLQRDAILIELNPGYAEITQRRITRDAGLFAEVT